MSFRNVYGYDWSENGWRMCNRDECVLVDGPHMNTAPLRRGAPAVILGDFVRRYNVQCAPVISPVWGWSATNDVGNSNHLSGTAVDINAPQWPWGYLTMPQALISKINTLLAFYEGAVFWGRKWNRPDEMHFQTGWREGDARYDRIIAKIIGTSLPTIPTTPPPVTGGYLQRGSTGQEVRNLQYGLNRVFPKYSKLVVDGDFGPATETAVKTFQRNSKLDPDGVVGPLTRKELNRYGILGSAPAPAPAPKPVEPTPPPAPKKRHLGIVFRGTGGIIGEDYVSRVMQGVSDLVEEINPEFPATMGGIPVGAAGDLKAPSMQAAVDIAVKDAKRIINERLADNLDLKIIVGGYSAGAVAAAKIRKWLLENHPDNYLCSFSLGDPTRPYGGSYYKGPLLDGQGISSWRFGDIKDYRHCWLTDPLDMYGNIPLGVAGDIMDDCFDMVTATQLSDPLGTAWAILQKIPEIMEKAGISATSILGWLTDMVPGSGMVQILMAALPGFIGRGDPEDLKGMAAAAYAAKFALGFATSNPPTASHIEYHLREVWPGQTYLGLAIQHVRDYASRVTPT